MWVGAGTGRFILHLMENSTTLGYFGGEGEQAALEGHRGACAAPQAGTTESLVPTHPGSSYQGAVLALHLG